MVLAPVAGCKTSLSMLTVLVLWRALALPPARAAIRQAPQAVLGERNDLELGPYSLSPPWRAPSCGSGSACTPGTGC
uniref:Putative secreted protein n=1 Tax=Ixodes ricinus TaxID=34613 RepID=A0A6B0TU92_IXORI